jgi:hypothetical protein
MRTRTIGLGLAAVFLASAIAIPVTANATEAAPPPDTVTAVTGDAANGFSIEYADGSSIHPPTDSEAMAECGEYETRIDRVRCRVEVRTWYRELAVLQQALDWANAN